MAAGKPATDLRCADRNGQRRVHLDVPAEERWRRVEQRNRTYTDPNRNGSYADRDGNRWNNDNNARRDGNRWNDDNNRRDSNRWSNNSNRRGNETWNDNNRRGNESWRNNARNDSRRWDRNWRNDNRYDWRRYRTSNRVVKQDGTMALIYTPLRMIKCKKKPA